MIDPLDTPQQREIELAAVRLLQKPEAIAAAKEVAVHWIERVKPNAAQRALFDFEYEQVKLCAAMDALNQDAIHPRMHSFFRFAHTVDGVPVPGTKQGNPNPDYAYRFVTIDDSSRYVIHGETVGQAPGVAEFAVLTAAQAYLANLSARHIAFDAGGRFTLTIDPDAPATKPKKARVNHMQTKTGASQILIRDMLTDITVQRPYKLSVERLGPATRAPLTEADALSIFPARLRKMVDDMLFIAEKMIYSKPANTFPTPMVHQGGIYAVSQAYAAGHYKIKSDEALVFTLTLGGAAYAVVPVNNVWGGLGDYLNHRGTLGTALSAPNPDGSYTFVLSIRDPGVANWVDPAGIEEGITFVRWAGLDPNYKGPAPTLQTQLVPIAELEQALRPGVLRADAAERKRQMAAHAAAYAPW